MPEPAVRIAERLVARVARALERPALGIHVVSATAAETIVAQWVDLAGRSAGDNVFFHSASLRTLSSVARPSGLPSSEKRMMVTMPSADDVPA